VFSVTSYRYKICIRTNYGKAENVKTAEDQIAKAASRSEGKLTKIDYADVNLTGFAKKSV